MHRSSACPASYRPSGGSSSRQRFLEAPAGWGERLKSPRDTADAQLGAIGRASSAVDAVAVQEIEILGVLSPRAVYSQSSATGNGLGRLRPNRRSASATATKPLTPESRCGVAPAWDGCVLGPLPGPWPRRAVPGGT